MRELNENGVNLERIKGNEEPRSKYFIIPEGDKTEIQYFSGIKANREDLNIKSLIEIKILENDEDEQGQSHPMRKIDNFIKSVKKGEINYSKDIDKVIFVIDRDPQNFSKKQLQEFVKRCNDNGYRTCLSNPTFEIFLLMHDDKIFDLDRKEMLENRRETKRSKRFLEKKLSEFFECSKTNLNFEKFKYNIKKAIKNEKCFCEELEDLENKLGSNVGRLLDSMIEE